MNDFTFYFEIGWQHIISLDAADHLLFITALSAIYLVNDWKKVLILVTAFTIGHSVTLALSVYDVIRINSKWVEFLIPVTILATAVINVFLKKNGTSPGKYNYFLALFFGCIHGLGFANTIRFMLARSQKIGYPLAGFNVGLEAGQILVVAFILLCSYLVVNKAGLNQKWWMYILSGLAGITALYLSFERLPF